MKHAAETKRAACAARFLPVLALAILLGFPVAGAHAQQQTFEPRIEEPEEFPDFPGREDTFYQCGACHAFQLVARQGMSRARWDGIVDLMTDRHGMPKLEGEERKTVLDYLEKAFPESTEPSGWQNPFLKR